MNDNIKKSDYGIRVEKVSKRFGEFQVLDKVDLKCSYGNIIGIMGRNGSGKTVLFKCICGLLMCDEGEIFLGNKNNIDYIQEDCGLGAIIEEPAFLKQYTGLKNLEILYLVRNKKNKDHLLQIMEKVGLNYCEKKLVGKYSLGMKQRLAIAQAIMENQQILVLDEPLNGLDNDGVNLIKKLLLDLKEEGKALLLASHNKEDLEEICDLIYVMEDGKLREMATE